MTPERAEFWRLLRAYLDPDSDVWTDDVVGGLLTMDEFRRWDHDELWRRVDDLFGRVGMDIPGAPIRLRGRVTDLGADR